MTRTRLDREKRGTNLGVEGRGDSGLTPRSVSMLAPKLDDRRTGPRDWMCERNVGETADQSFEVVLVDNRHDILSSIPLTYCYRVQLLRWLVSESCLRSHAGLLV